MNATVTLVVQLLTNLLPMIGSFTSGSVASTITLLEQIIPAVVKEGEDLIMPIQNIITALQSSGTVTADQVAQLQAQSDTLDAALDAAAKADGLT